MTQMQFWRTLRIRLLQRVPALGYLQLVERYNDCRPMHQKLQGDWSTPSCGELRYRKSFPRQYSCNWLTISVHVGPSGMAVYNYHPFPVDNLVLGIQHRDVEDGPVNLASTAPMLGTTLLRSKVI